MNLQELMDEMAYAGSKHILFDLGFVTVCIDMPKKGGDEYTWNYKAPDGSVSKGKGLVSDENVPAGLSQLLSWMDDV